MLELVILCVVFGFALDIVCYVLEELWDSAPQWFAGGATVVTILGILSLLVILL